MNIDDMAIGIGKLDQMRVRIAQLEAENAKLRRQVEFVKRESLLAIPDRCGRHEETKCLLCKGQWYVECAPRHEKDCPHDEASKCQD